MELTTSFESILHDVALFMITKIQKLNGTHNITIAVDCTNNVVYDYKDTKIEWNSQRHLTNPTSLLCCL